MPRKVLSLCRGHGDLYLVTPIRGEHFIVNGDHVLHLECTREGKRFPSAKQGGEVDHITVRDYLQKPRSWKHLRKLRQSNAVEFQAIKDKGLLFDDGFEIPPYIVGLMLGDGHMKHAITLTTADRECADEFTKFAVSKRWDVVAEENPRTKAKSYRIRSNRKGQTCPARALFAQYGMLGKTGYDKCIPKKYAVSPAWVRKELLAGLIDSDGSHDGAGGFQFINKSESLARGVAFVARSLGLRARVKIARKECQTCDKRIYWSVQISGNTEIIPCRIPRKQAKPRRQKKSPLRYGFKVQAFGVGDYYGFTLDGDHLYLDGNFLIHHNSGKSLVIADLCREAIERWGGRVLVLAHRQELLTQNAVKIREACPDLDVGVYSAGLDSRDTDHGIIVAGIQSVFRRAGEFGQRHLVLIDEVHLVAHDGEGMYRRFLDALRGINPHLRMVGLTATPYRLDSGPLCRPDGLFQKICYSAPVRQLIDEGYLCRLTTRPSDLAVDTSGLHLRGGEFVASEAERLFCGVVHEACRELVRLAAGRRSVLVFASGVSHADQVAVALERLTGQRVGVVTGETWPMLRAQTLADFRAGRLRWCVNCEVLTTGFDAPGIDCIAVLRATMSPGLFAQIVGRGFRVHPGKADCLVLDFGGNIRRHGPIDSPDYGVQDKRQRTAGDAPVKSCPNCETEVLIAATECPECGWRFPRPTEATHDAEADDTSILSEPETFLVEAVHYACHQKRKAGPEDPPTMRVDYECRKDGAAGNLATEVISEWICFEHPSYAGAKARRWWQTRSVAPFPDSVSEAVDLCRRGAVSSPRSIVAAKQGRWWRILSAALDERPDEWADCLLGEDPFETVEEEVPF